MIEFEITDVHKDPENIELEELHEIYLNIEGNLSVTLNSQLYFNEQICIVEFAVALSDWLKNRLDTPFKYESMDDDDPDTFDINTRPNGFYLFKSSWQECEVNDTFSQNEIIDFICNYIVKVKAMILKNFKINLNDRVGL